MLDPLLNAALSINKAVQTPLSYRRMTHQGHLVTRMNYNIEHVHDVRRLETLKCVHFHLECPPLKKNFLCVMAWVNRDTSAARKPNLIHPRKARQQFASNRRNRIFTALLHL